jgi:hypothetical protein
MRHRLMLSVARFRQASTAIATPQQPRRQRPPRSPERTQYRSQHCARNIAAKPNPTDEALGVITPVRYELAAPSGQPMVTLTTIPRRRCSVCDASVCIAPFSGVHHVQRPSAQLVRRDTPSTRLRRHIVRSRDDGCLQRVTPARNDAPVETRRTAANADAHGETRTSRVGTKPDRRSPAHVRAARATCTRVRPDATKHQPRRARQHFGTDATCEPEQGYRERDARQT